jgi:hypothetical protein
VIKSGWIKFSWKADEKKYPRFQRKFMRVSSSLKTILMPLIIGYCALPISSQENFSISNFDDLIASNAIHSALDWNFVTDFDSHGNSTIISGDTTTNPATVDAKSFDVGQGGTKHCLKMEYKYGTIRPSGDAPDTSTFDPEVGLETALFPDTGIGEDFRGATTITFWAKASKSTKMRFMMGTPEIMDYSYYGSDFTVTTNWKLFTVELKPSKTFAQAAWGAPQVPFNISRVTTLAFTISQADNPGVGGVFYVDEIIIHNWTPQVAVAIKPLTAQSKALVGGILEANRTFTVQLPSALRKTRGQVQIFGSNGNSLGGIGYGVGTQEVRVPLQHEAREQVFFRVIPTK